MYMRWHNMIRRCEDPSFAGFEHYGAHGIKVCSRWHAFEVFWADIGNPPTRKHSIDRINNDGDYEPSNIRWATPRQQAMNKRQRKPLTRFTNHVNMPNMTHEIPRAPDGKSTPTRTTKTLSVRLPLAQALEIEKQAREKGYTNTNQYLVAMIGFIAPLTPPAPVEQESKCPEPSATLQPSTS